MTRKEADTISKYSEMRRNKTAFIFYVWSAYLVYLAGLFVCFVNIDIHAIVHNEMAMGDISLTEFLEENCNSEKLMTWSRFPHSGSATTFGQHVFFSKSSDAYLRRLYSAVSYEHWNGLAKFRNIPLHVSTSDPQKLEPTNVYKEFISL